MQKPTAAAGTRNWIAKYGINRRVIRIKSRTMQGQTFSVDVLDNPIWFALTTHHESLALSHGSARRYPKTVSPFAALLKPTPHAFEDLRSLVTPDERVALFTSAPLDVPRTFHVEVSRWIEQMTCKVLPAA